MSTSLQVAALIGIALACLGAASGALYLRQARAWRGLAATRGWEYRVDRIAGSRLSGRAGDRQVSVELARFRRGADTLVHTRVTVEPARPTPDAGPARPGWSAAPLALPRHPEPEPGELDQPGPPGAQHQFAAARAGALPEQDVLDALAALPFSSVSCGPTGVTVEVPGVSARPADLAQVVDLALRVAGLLYPPGGTVRR